MRPFTVYYRVYIIIRQLEGVAVVGPGLDDINVFLFMERRLT